MVIAEVELETEEQLNTVVIPDFIQKALIKDITSEKEFSNYNLADQIIQQN
jgi:CYTH domain-containing protein